MTTPATPAPQDDPPTPAAPSAQTSTEPIRDPDLYEKLLTPFPSHADAEAALRAFFKDVRALREQHGLPDVAVVATVIVDDPGGEYSVASSAYNGDPSKETTLLAWALGKAEADLLARIEQTRKLAHDTARDRNKA